ncbi:hypothetical protein FF1_010003 [Malus domestica]
MVSKGSCDPDDPTVDPPLAVTLDDLKWENETPQKLPLDAIGLLFLCISMFTAIDCPQIPFEAEVSCSKPIASAH